MNIDQLCYLFLYLILGLGAWAQAKYIGPGNETPFVSFVAIIFWPALLIMCAIGFMFLGKRAK